MAPLLIRVHGMELATTGIIVALCIGLASSLGTAGTGLKVDAINKRRGFSARRSALFAAAMPILSTLFGTVARSEEHTSELQSLMRISYAVFCLKKKKNHTTIMYRNHII